MARLKVSPWLLCTVSEGAQFFLFYLILFFVIPVADVAPAFAAHVEFFSFFGGYVKDTFGIDA